MSTTTSEHARCGCGMLGPARLVAAAGHGSRRLWRVQNCEAQFVHHRLATWWCSDCRRMEWMCLASGAGRHHHRGTRLPEERIPQ